MTFAYVRISAGAIIEMLIFNNFKRKKTLVEVELQSKQSN